MRHAAAFALMGLLAISSAQAQTQSNRAPMAPGASGASMAPAARAERAAEAERAPSGPAGMPMATDPERRTDPETVSDQRDPQVDVPTDRSTAPGVKRDTKPSVNGAYK